MVVFDVRREFLLHQSNGATVKLNLDQDGEALGGRAVAPGVDLISHAVTGRTRDSQFFLTITWNQGSIGEYHGSFNGGRLSGITFDQTRPDSQATWFADRDFGRLL